MRSEPAVTLGPAALDALGVDGDSARHDNRNPEMCGFLSFFGFVCACDKAPCCQRDAEHAVGVR